MPRRPPKEWMRECVGSVRASGTARDPGAVCGAIWYHKLTPAERAARLRGRENGGNPRAMASTAIAVRRALAHRPRTARPIVIRTREVIKPKHKRRHGRRGGRSEKQRLGIMAAGFVLGLIDKSGMDIPTLPYVGRAGTLAIAAYVGERYLGFGSWADDAATGFGTIALYELGKEGSISGDGDGDYIAGDF